MSSEDPSIKKQPMKYSKVVANIPEGLIKEFDTVCESRYYSRAEGIKQAMREFIIGSLPEDYVPSSINKKQMKEGFEGMIEGIIKLVSDTRLQQLQNQQNTNIQTPSLNSQLTQPNLKKNKKQ